MSWSDMTKPLYSALAARLFLTNVPTSIPQDLTGQAQYWKNHYNSGAGAETWEKFRDDVQTLERGTTVAQTLSYYLLPTLLLRIAESPFIVLTEGDCPGPSTKASEFYPQDEHFFHVHV